MSGSSRPLDPKHAHHAEPTLAEPHEHADSLAGHPIELWIAYTLRAGVILAALIIASGVVVYLVRGAGPNDPRTLSELLHTHATSVTLRQIIHDAVRGHGTALIELGVLVLILTPIIRVGMTMLLFVGERDAVFLAIVSIVFVILVIGIVGVGV